MTDDMATSSTMRSLLFKRGRLADLEGEESNHHSQVLWTRGLLIRRNIANGDLAYFTTWCPAGTSIETLVSVEGHRWAIEDSFETAKNEFGLDHNESRSWHGWHRHGAGSGATAFAPGWFSLVALINAEFTVAEQYGIVLSFFLGFRSFAVG